MTNLERLLDKVMPVPECGCWLWLGSTNGNGYGNFSYQGRTRNAHRVSYELHYGSIPEGMEIDHKCRMRCCVNPAHLEPVTHAENMRRSPDAAPAVYRNKTHCPNGHPYVGENLYRYKGKRHCRTCLVKRTREWRATKRNLEAK